MPTIRRSSRASRIKSRAPSVTAFSNTRDNCSTEASTPCSPRCSTKSRAHSRQSLIAAGAMEKVCVTVVFKMLSSTQFATHQPDAALLVVLQTAVYDREFAGAIYGKLSHQQTLKTSVPAAGGIAAARNEDWRGECLPTIARPGDAETARVLAPVRIKFPKQVDITLPIQTE
jgi:hypothetical protein